LGCLFKESVFKKSLVEFKVHCAFSCLCLSWNLHSGAHIFFFITWTWYRACHRFGQAKFANGGSILWSIQFTLLFLMPPGPWISIGQGKLFKKIKVCLLRAYLGWSLKHVARYDFFIAISQYCVPKCLVWIRPKNDAWFENGQNILKNNHLVSLI